MSSRGGAERFEDGDGGEDEDGDDRRRAKQIPDVFRDFRLAFHHTTCVRQCPAVLGHTWNVLTQCAAMLAHKGG